MAGATQVAAGLGPGGPALVREAHEAFTDGFAEALLGLGLVVVALNGLIVLYAPDRHGRTLRARRGEARPDSPTALRGSDLTRR